MDFSGSTLMGAQYPSGPIMAWGVDQLAPMPPRLVGEDTVMHQKVTLDPCLASVEVPSGPFVLKLPHKLRSWPELAERRGRA